MLSKDIILSLAHRMASVYKHDHAGPGQHLYHFEQHTLVDFANAIAEAARDQTLPAQLSDKQVVSACYSFRHDYGLLDSAKQTDVAGTCRQWWHAITKELSQPSQHPFVLATAAGLPLPLGQIEGIAVGNGQRHEPDSWQAVMAEMADDIECEAKNTYVSREQYPSEMRRFKSSMAIVERARALLDEHAVVILAHDDAAG